MPTDPICGMYVEGRRESLQLTRENRTYYFCSEGCQLAFAEPEHERKRLLSRLLVAWPLSVIVLVLTYVPSGSGGIYLAAVFAAVVQFYPGSVFYRGTYDALRNRVANMDVLIAVGTSAAFAYSVAVLALPGRLPPEYFFDASALIITLILTGNYLEHLTRARATSALRSLNELLPAQASVLKDGQELLVAVAEVAVGDRLRVRPGARFPVDGVIHVGRTTVDESILTGESIPLARGPGERVIAGAINGEGLVELEATQVGSDTFVAQVGQLLTAAEMSRVPLQRTADRIASVFVPLVLAIALAAALGWGFLGGADFTIALLVFVTVSITACPCAFGIATPAAIMVGTGRAAEEGVLFRGEDAIERAARADTVLADKTGTLTTAAPELTEWIPLGTEPGDALLAIAAGLESGSEHALARAVIAKAEARRIVPVTVDDIHTDPGRGVLGTYHGRPVAILRGEAARELGVDLRPAANEIAHAEAQGDSWSVVVADRTLLGLLCFRTPLAPGAAEAVARLRGMGVEVVMVTGDHPAAARKVADALGIGTIFAETTPSRKVEVVRRFQSEGHRVAFVGDGINDAAALAAADVGIAIGTGTDVAREAGQVLLIRDDFAGVPTALRMARRTVAGVRRNLEWAIGYNAVLLPVAAGALVPFFGLSIYTVLPIVGALAMGLSSTTVVLNSLLVRRGEPRPTVPRTRAIGTA